MKRHGYAAPAIVAAIFLLYYLGMIVLFIAMPGVAWWIKLLLCVIPAAIGGVVIGVTVQRIREIRSGETDDLHKY